MIMAITKRPQAKKGKKRVPVPTATPTKVKVSIKKPGALQKIFNYSLPKSPGPDALAVKIERALTKKKRQRKQLHERVD